MKKLGEFIHRILSVLLLGLLCVPCMGCSYINYEINDNLVYFKLGYAIWKYEKVYIINLNNDKVITIR